MRCKSDNDKQVLSLRYSLASKEAGREIIARNNLTKFCYPEFYENTNVGIKKQKNKSKC